RVRVRRHTEGEGEEAHRAKVIKARCSGMFWHRHDGGGFKVCGDSYLGQKQVEDVSQDHSQLPSTGPEHASVEASVRGWWSLGSTALMAASWLSLSKRA